MVETPSFEISDDLAAYRPALFRLALLQLGDKAAAEDATQETLLAALEGSEKFEGRSSLRTWLFSILRFKVLDAIRERARTRKKIESDLTLAEELDISDFDALFDQLGCWAAPKDIWTDPQTAAEQSDFFRVLEACMERLPSRTSRAFLMRTWLELDPDDVCSELSITPGNLRILLYRARMQLRHCLDLTWDRTP